MSRGPARALVLEVRGPLARSDLTGLYARAWALLSEREVEVVLCGVAGVAADAVAVEALARLQLAARRRGADIRLCGPRVLVVAPRGPARGRQRVGPPARRAARRRRL